MAIENYPPWPETQKAASCDVCCGMKSTLCIITWLTKIHGRKKTVFSAFVAAQNSEANPGTGFPNQYLKPIWFIPNQSQPYLFEFERWNYEFWGKKWQKAEAAAWNEDTYFVSPAVVGTVPCITAGCWDDVRIQQYCNWVARRSNHTWVCSFTKHAS